MGSRDTKIDDVMDVCRLCLGNEDLISVFDDRIKIPENIIDVIRITTGVTITPSDNVSQKLCNKCLHITIKMFKFRSSSNVNDMELKTRAARKLQSNLNKTVEVLLRKYPTIVLPSSIIKSNISPVVMVTRNEISRWTEKSKILKKTKKSEPMKIATKTMINSETPAVTIEIENNIRPYPTPNEAISAPPQSLMLNEVDSQKLQTSTPQLISVVQEITKVSEPQKPPQFEVPFTNSDKIVSESIITSMNRQNKTKRKLSPSINSDKSKKIKTDADPVERDHSEDSLVTLKYVTKSLFICDSCNKILYSAKDLRKHKMNHMRCHLCKKTFRSMEETKKHSESGCPIKQIMSNLPTINLVRCDQSVEIRDQYALIFGGCNKTIENVEVCPILPVEYPTNISEECSKDPLEVETAIVKQDPLYPDSKAGTEPMVEILLISDEEHEAKEIFSNKMNVIQTACNAKKNETKHVPLENNINSNNISTKPITDNSFVKNTSDLHILNSSSLKPDIEIVGENILDVNLDDNDISLLKNILRRSRKHLKEAGVQTDIPCNVDVIPSLNKDKLFELKNLKKFLNFYKIPVNVYYAPQYSARYSYEPSPLLKKDRSWSKIITKLPTASKTSSVNDIPPTKILNNNTTYQIVSTISSQVLSCETSIEPAISSIWKKMGLPSYQQPHTVVNIQKESKCSVARAFAPTIFTTTSSSLPEISGTFDIAVPSIPPICYTFNQNSCSETTTSSQSLISTIHQKAINCNLPNDSLLSKVLSNQIVRPNYVSSNNNITPTITKPNNFASATTKKDNRQTSEVIHASVANLQLRPSANSMPTTPISYNRPLLKNVFISPRVGTLVTKPTTTNSEFSVSSLSQNTSDSKVAPNLENNKESNFVPIIRVKDVSELI